MWTVAAGLVEFEGCAVSSDCPALHECLPLSAGPDSGEISFDSIGPAMATLMRVACQLAPIILPCSSCYQRQLFNIMIWSLPVSSSSLSYQLLSMVSVLA
jgi:hypothetical protein